MSVPVKDLIKYCQSQRKIYMNRNQGLRGDIAWVREQIRHFSGSPANKEFVENLKSRLEDNRGDVFFNTRQVDIYGNLIRICQKFYDGVDSGK